MIEFHPLAELFPLIEGREFDDLVADIVANDLRDPIVILDGEILDGRNRYRALLAADRLDPKDGPDRQRYFTRFVREVDGDPLKFVISKNLSRRHLNDIQRASVAAKIANLGRGRPAAPAPENPPIGGISARAAAAALNVPERQVERARVVHESGVQEVREALDRGQIAVSAAEKIARMPEHVQREEVARHLPHGSRAIMGSRQEPDDSLDYFPTPPWATRALFEGVLPHIGVDRFRSVWEPACGEGHIAEVAREYCPTVHASDVFDYGYGGVADFLTMADHPNADWIITNPPFGDLALQFVDRALGLANLGVAMFFRSQWAVEGIERYETIFRDRPPTLCAFFVERVNLCKGRWEPDGSTATAYCWLVWKRGERAQPPFWIPPGQRDALTKPDDRERFTAHPVTARVVCNEPFDKDTGEIAEAPAPAAPANPESKPEDDLSIPPFLLRVPKGEAVA